MSDGERSGIDMEVLEDRVVATEAVVASSNDGGVQDCRPETINKQRFALLCSTEERSSFSSGTSGGWVNDDGMFIFGWTVSLSESSILSLPEHCGNVTFKCLNVNFKWKFYE